MREGREREGTDRPQGIVLGIRHTCFRGAFSALAASPAGRAWDRMSMRCMRCGRRASESVRGREEILARE